MAASDGERSRLRGRVPLAAALAACAWTAAAAGPAAGPCAARPEHCTPYKAQRYAEEIQNAVLAHWQPPTGLGADRICVFELRQRPGGQVSAVTAAQPCSFDAPARESFAAAARAAQPLPYQGYEQVFRPVLRLEIRGPDPDDPPPRRWWQRLRERGKDR